MFVEGVDSIDCDCVHVYQELQTPKRPLVLSITFPSDDASTDKVPKEKDVNLVALD